MKKKTLVLFGVLSFILGVIFMAIPTDAKADPIYTTFDMDATQDPFCYIGGGTLVCYGEQQ